MTGGGNIYFLPDDERMAILWAIALGLAYDDGFPSPCDQNREILRSARDRLTFPHKVEDDG